jgi:hypothetical protein
MPRIAVLPLDDRPVTYDFPRSIGALAGVEVLVPPRDLLGNLTRVADREALGAWLEAVGPTVDAVVVALDTLGYGGLIPSRRSPEDVSAVMGFLRPLVRLKEANPALPVFGFNVTMRLSNSNVNEEEKPYWDQYGELIYRWSFHQHRFKAEAAEADRVIAAEAKRQIPPAILEDYLGTRERNHAVNQTMIKWAAGDFFTALLLTQDDTSPFGLNVQEQQELQLMITTSQIAERVLVYPGADEVASVLVARAVNDLQKRTPTFAVSWHPLDGKRVIAMYEDRPLWQTLRGQIRAVGGKEVSNEQMADVVVVVNTPASAQGDLALRYNLDAPDTPMRNLEPLLLTLEAATTQAAPRPVHAFADVAYANGADPRLMPLLVERLGQHIFGALEGFAAWNTAGNTFGTLVATASAARTPGADREALERFISERLADDWLYQSVIRPELQQRQSQGESLAALKVELDERLQALWQQYFPHHPARFKTYFPWDRLFEAGISRSDITRAP